MPGLLSNARIVASRPAINVLSARNARASGCFLTLSKYAFFTNNDACLGTSKKLVP